MTVSTQIINNAAAYGGGICVQFQGKVNVTNSVISENRAYSGGGLYISTGNWVCIIFFLFTREETFLTL
jgi:hypothetical protein